MTKITEFQFTYNVEKYYKLRDGIESIFPGLQDEDEQIKEWLIALESLEHQIKHYIMGKYCVEDDPLK